MSRLLRSTLPLPPSSYIFIDFCAGGGGPTPSIEHHLNNDNHHKSSSRSDHLVRFVLTDLHPHVDLWEKAAARSANVSFVREPVDAANAPRELTERYRREGKRVFRLFNLAFHHFGDGLARRILRDTVEGGGDGFG